ncbi:MAG: hypothetical protein ACJ8BW_05675 [Ktedonobacteraceae bacterium]
MQHIQHTAGIYSFFTRLAQDARREAGQALYWWETGVQCERRYRVIQQWYNLRPDALAEYRMGVQMYGTCRLSFSPTHTTLPRMSGQENAQCCRCWSVSRRISRRRGGCTVAQARLTSPPTLAVWTT